MVAATSVVFPCPSSAVAPFFELDGLAAEPLLLAPPATVAPLELDAPFASAATTVAAVVGFLIPSFGEAPVLLGRVFATASARFFGFAAVVGPFLETDALPAKPPATPAAVAGPPCGEVLASEEGVLAAAFVFFEVPEVGSFLALDAFGAKPRPLAPFTLSVTVKVVRLSTPPFVETLAPLEGVLAGASAGFFGGIPAARPFFGLDALPAEPLLPAAVFAPFF